MGAIVNDDDDVPMDSSVPVVSLVPVVPPVSVVPQVPVVPFVPDLQYFNIIFGCVIILSYYPYKQSTDSAIL